MKKSLNSLILLSVLIFGTTVLNAQSIPSFKIMTEPWAPWQIEENGEVKGVAVDLLVLILERAGSNQNHEDIKMVPWARGYRRTLEEQNTILFSTTRTDERENLFKWVGPIFTNTSYLMAKKSSNISINSVEEISNYTIGTVIDDVGEQNLLKLGVPLESMDRTSRSIANTQKLNAGRVDLISSDASLFESHMKELGLNGDDFEIVFTIDTREICYAFNIKTPDSVITEFQNIFDELIAEGVLEDLLKKYE